VKSLGPDPLRAAHMFGEQAALVLALLENRTRRRNPDAAALAHLGSMPGSGEFSVKVYDAQRARLAGNDRASAMLTREAEELRRPMDASVSPDLAVLGVHFRNVLASGSDTAGQATHFFREKLRAGYACFRRDAPA
jgi:hypothetical protein